MLTGFKDFLFRGNIVDLAVAVVIGTAFTMLVSSFTTNLINPVIARAGGGGADAGGLGVALGDSPATFLNVGAFLTAIITFIITAAVVYFFVVVPMKRFMENIAPPSEDVILLREIRDLLGAASTGSTSGASTLGDVTQGRGAAVRRGVAHCRASGHRARPTRGRTRRG
ncbi:MAG: large conductance mechanosensitive channel protein MscL [Nocardioidaceae bacterium]